MSGQNPNAPSNARNSLKNGIAMAITVAIITKTVLQISLNKLMLNVKEPILFRRSLFMKDDCGHVMLAPISTIRNIG